MIKLVTSDSYDFGDLGARLVPISRKGVDQQFVKHAGEGVFHEFLKDVKPTPNKTVIHVLAVGDEEKYGANRNADAFSGKDNKTAHKSFKDIGHVFRNHQSDDPAKGVGEVLATAHNPRMHRIELMLALDNKKCAREVEAVNSGREVPVSMGSMQKFDVCSLCGHEAPTAKDHCAHVTDMLGLVAENGRKIYMQNPNPKYFDISLVFKPADRIAYTLRKVASGCAIGGHDLAVEAGLSGWGSPKYALKRVLATLVKQIPGSIKRTTKPGKLASETIAELQKHAASYGLDHLLHNLHENQWLLSPGDFGRLIGADPACVEAGESEGSIDKLAADDSEVSSLEAPDYPQYIPFSDSAASNLMCKCGMGDVQVNNRIMRLSIQPEIIKVAQPVDQSLAAGLGLLYGHYKLAFGLHHQDQRPVLHTLAASW